MTDRAHYEPGPANLATVEKTNAEKWALIVSKDLRHSPQVVWNALTDPSQLREWAPFDADGALDKPGATVTFQWAGTPTGFETTVKRAESPHILEYASPDMDLRWKLEPIPGGTRLTLWTNIDRNYISMGAAGWHIAFDVLERLLDGTPISRISGNDAFAFAGWQRLNAEYATQWGIKPPTW